MTTTEPEHSFGYYAPNNSTLLLRTLTKLGISRGVVRKWVDKQWRKKGYTVVDTTIQGIKYRLHICENTTDAKILTSSKFYDGDEISYLSSAVQKFNNNDATFVDVGANTGYYSLNLAQLGYSQIIAIEPNPPTLAILNFNVYANDLVSKITVVPVCIGNGQDIPFYCSGGLGNASVFSECHKSDPVMIHSKPLLDILIDHGIQRVHGLKIDVEGFEDRCLLPFFRDAPKHFWPSVIVIEVCNKHLWNDDILVTMKDIGYRMERRTHANQILKQTGLNP